MSGDSVQTIKTKIQAISEEVQQVIVGKEDVVRLVLASLVAKGHVLIEDVPGVGKTTLAKAVSKAVGCTFSRIQFTPDMLPSDITGTSIYNQSTGDFVFKPGPIFANILLADEINRAMPKTQSALLESMEELQVTTDGVTRPLSKPFLVIATQNNIEHGSTYPLPEAQMDRFMIRVSIGYPSQQDEVAVLDAQLRGHPIGEVTPIITPDELISLQDGAKKVHLDDSLKDYIVRIASDTRNRPDVVLGASPRGSLALMRISRALAAMSGRDYVLPDDVKEAAIPVIAHRLMLVQDANNAEDAQNIVKDILSSVPVPVKYGEA